MKESDVHEAIVKSLEKQYGRRGRGVAKIHGDPMQTRGLPDLMGCLHGKGIAWECKLISMPARRTTTIIKANLFTQLQVYWLKRFGEAGADSAGMVFIYHPSRRVSDYLVKIPWDVLGRMIRQGELKHLTGDKWPHSFEDAGMTIIEVKQRTGRFIDFSQGESDV